MVEECDKDLKLSFYTKTQHKIKVIVIYCKQVTLT